MSGRWFLRPEILNYIIDSHAGVEERDTGHRVKARRVFIWVEPSGDVVIGNTQAFALHLREKFQLLNTALASDIHQVMRDLGEVVDPDYPKTRAERKGKTNWKEPAPDSKIIGHKEDA